MNPSQKPYRPYTKKAPYKPKNMDDKIRAIVKQETAKTSKKKESKMFDLSIVATGTLDYNGATYDLTGGITQGSGDTNYIGSNIMPTTVRIKWSCPPGDATNLLRIIVLQTIGGGVPTAATVFQSVGNVRAPLSPYDRQYMNTFKVLSDNLYSMVGGTETGLITGDIRIRWNKLRQISYTNASGTVEANGLYMLLVTDSVTTPNPLFQAYARVYYKDD